MPCEHPSYPDEGLPDIVPLTSCLQTQRLFRKLQKLLCVNVRTKAALCFETEMTNLAILTERLAALAQVCQATP